MGALSAKHDILFNVQKLCFMVFPQGVGVDVREPVPDPLGQCGVVDVPQLRTFATFVCSRMSLEKLSRGDAECANRSITSYRRGHTETRALVQSNLRRVKMRWAASQSTCGAQSKFQEHFQRALAQANSQEHTCSSKLARAYLGRELAREYDEISLCSARRIVHSVKRPHLTLYLPRALYSVMLAGHVFTPCFVLCRLCWPRRFAGAVSPGYNAGPRW